MSGQPDSPGQLGPTPTYTIEAAMVHGRVFVDLGGLVTQFRRRAVWWLEQVSVGDKPELTEEEFNLVVVGNGIAAELEDRADQLDVLGMEFRTLSEPAPGE